MHFISLLSQRRIFLYTIAATSFLMVVFGLLYDYLFQEIACILCWMQRGVLLLICVCALLSLRFRMHYLIILFSILGLILGLRHIYVILFPMKVTQCMPFELLFDLPGQMFFREFLVWLSTIGRECTINISMATYVLVPVLLIYYSSILLYYFRYHRRHYKSI